MKLTFINKIGASFTPTQSGALATIIYELYKQAEKDGVESAVLTAPWTAPSFPVDNIFYIPRPDVSNRKFDPVRLYYRAEQKRLALPTVKQPKWIGQVIKTIEKEGLQDRPMILLNSPYEAIKLRERFPNNVIVHWFQNQFKYDERWKKIYAQSNIVSAACSDFTARWVEQDWKLPAGSVHTLYNGADIKHFKPAENFPTGKPIINWTGRTSPEKGPDILLEAALQISEQTRDFSLQILGWNSFHAFFADEYQDKLTALSNKLEERGIEVRRPGHIGRDFLPGEMQKAQIHVMTSRWDEPFGMVTVEGMALALATVASNTGGTPEIIKGHGLLFERDNPTDLAKQLLPLVQDEKYRREMGQKCLQRAHFFCWENSWAKLKSMVS